MARLKGVSAQRLTLDELSIVEQLSLSAAWRPPKYEHDRHDIRWRTWGEFLAAWDAVRAEALAARAAGAQEWQRDIFAEQVRDYAAAHGAEALEAASYERIKSWRG